MLKMIHDLDEFLYPTYPDAGNIMGDAAAIAAVEDCGLAISVAEARALIDRSYNEHHDWRDLLVSDHKADPDHLHAAYHKRLDHKLIVPYPQLSKSFSDLSGHASHVILTHSAAEWASRTVDHLSLRPWFPDERILAWEKYKALKSFSTKGFEMAARLLDADPREVTFGDDSLRNLKTAKDMGMTTIWASHGKPLPAGQAHYVDHIVGNIDIFMQQQVALIGKPSP